MGFTPAQRAILVDLLIFGANKAENIAHRTNNHPNSISKYTNTMVDQGYLEPKGGGVYRLTDKGRQAAEGMVLSGDLPYGTDDDD